jgi:hypothetical protein
MAGYYQKRAVQVNPPLGWQMQFAQLGNSRKMVCIVCGSQGYPSYTNPHGWQATCLLGHPEECPDCGARFVKGGLAQHLRCKLGHRACPQHNDTQHRRLMRGLIDA